MSSQPTPSKRPSRPVSAKGKATTAESMSAEVLSETNGSRVADAAAEPTSSNSNFIASVAEVCDWSPCVPARVQRYRHKSKDVPLTGRYHVMGKENVETGTASADSGAETSVAQPRLGLRGRDPFRSTNQVNKSVGRMFLTKGVSQDLEAHCRMTSWPLKPSTSSASLSSHHPSASCLVVEPSRLVFLSSCNCVGYHGNHQATGNVTTARSVSTCRSISNGRRNVGRTPAVSSVSRVTNDLKATDAVVKESPIDAVGVQSPDKNEEVRENMHGESEEKQGDAVSALLNDDNGVLLDVFVPKVTSFLNADGSNDR